MLERFLSGHETKAKHSSAFSYIRTVGGRSLVCASLMLSFLPLVVSYVLLKFHNISFCRSHDPKPAEFFPFPTLFCSFPGLLRVCSRTSQRFSFCQAPRIIKNKEQLDTSGAEKWWSMLNVCVWQVHLLAQNFTMDLILLPGVSTTPCDNGYSLILKILMATSKSTVLFECWGGPDIIPPLLKNLCTFPTSFHLLNK